MSTRRLVVPATIFFLLFTVSGFAGLIYQSIWSHYLKLFLGHAAYAQTIVLAMFMGGMAIGAWICARYSSRIRNPLRGYAVAEFIIGLFALIFHWLFTNVLDFSYSSVFPHIGTGIGIDLYKWALAGLLILPQSILLGTTFPLMSAGVLRRFPQTPGSVIALLYFTNSLGAAVGVLASGFFMIGKFGLPGTLLTAGLINIFLAIIVWAISKPLDERTEQSASTDTHTNTANGVTLRTPPERRVLNTMLVIALLTGAASFVYEIAWIRMLSLVLGSSTHAFEIMLSALILGLAFGSLWIRKRLDHYASLRTVLGVVLVAKGLLAIATLPLYGRTFEAMQLVLNTLSRSEESYIAFNGFSHLIAISIMFPSAFFAGMSLPLITCILLKRGFGESSIGSVYAWNTVGAIIGVMFAVHIGLGLLGLKNLVLAAALIDVGIAIALLVATRQQHRRWLLPTAMCIAIAALGIVAVGVEFDQIKMASGVYRDGKLFEAGASRVVFNKDGKTATINVIEHSNGKVAISTNGKTDASLRMSGGSVPDGDEYTMILAGALPLAYRPDAKRIANIGFGSGLTAHAILGSPTVEKIDNIEIEPAMIEGARAFGPRVARAYEDKRSHFYIDDAKSFFAAQRSKYDVIISEPSNPWVSGVAGLFSTEFYARVRDYLADDGILVQWIQLYEIDTLLVASIMKSLGNHFSDYVAFEISGSEMIVLAVPKGRVGEISDRIFKMPLMASQLAALNIHNVNDLLLRRIGGRATLDPMLRSFPIAANSDFFPIVDLNAAKARFLEKRATALPELNVGDTPVIDILERKTFPKLPREALEPSQFQVSLRHQQAMTAYRVRRYILDGPYSVKGANLPAWQTKIAYFNGRLYDCDSLETDPTWAAQLHEIGRLLSAYMSPQDAADVWKRIESTKCAGGFSLATNRLIALFKAVAERDPTKIAPLATSILGAGNSLPIPEKTYLLHVGMAAQLALGRGDLAATLWTTHGRDVAALGEMTITTRMLLAMASQ